MIERPPYQVVNTEHEFTLIVQTNDGEQSFNLNASGYVHPCLWTWQGRRWAWFTAYYDGLVPIERPLEIVDHETPIVPAIP